MLTPIHGRSPRYFECGNVFVLREKALSKPSSFSTHDPSVSGEIGVVGEPGRNTVLESRHRETMQAGIHLSNIHMIRLQFLPSHHCLV